MALQSTPTYRVAMDWLTGFSEALHRGELPAFVMQGRMPQRSPAKSQGLTQISFINTSLPKPARDEVEETSAELEEKPAVPVQQTRERQEEKQEDHATGTCSSFSDAEESHPDTSSSCVSTGHGPESTGHGPDSTGQEPDCTGQEPNATNRGSKEDPISFAEPPRIRGLSKREKRRLAGGKELREARTLAVKIRDGKKTRKARLDDVAALLEGPYNYDMANAMVAALDLQTVTVEGQLSVRPYNVGQRVPQIRAIPQQDKIKEAIEAVKARNNLKLLAYWPDYGSATFDQLEVMDGILEARSQFQLVELTLDWIEGVQWNVNDVVAPFTDTCDFTKVSSYTNKQNHTGRYRNLQVLLMNVNATNVQRSSAWNAIRTSSSGT
ncbi:hypothetical protein DVH05_022617 [Phytophthora capsici]|nr:hypothetical protein DVH05_022617 [Phytophthora capsici]